MHQGEAHLLKNPKPAFPRDFDRSTGLKRSPIDNGLSISVDHSMLRRTITVNQRWCEFVFHFVPICERHDVLDRGTRWGARKGCPAHRIDLELI